MKVKDLVYKLLEVDQEIDIINYDDEWNDQSRAVKIDLLIFYTQYPKADYLKMYYNYES